MFDGHFRANAEQKLQPVGAQIRRTGISADHLTALGVVMALAAAVAIGAGALRAGLVLLVLTALPDVLDGAVAKASGTASPRGAFFDSVSDRLTDALLLGGVAWYLATTQPGRVAVLPLAVLAASMLVSYERAKAESLGFDATGGLMERAERLIALGFGLLFSQVLVAVLWVMLVLTAVHRRPAVRQGVAARPPSARRRPDPARTGQSTEEPPDRSPYDERLAEPFTAPPLLLIRPLVPVDRVYAAFRAGALAARALPGPAVAAVGSDRSAERRRALTGRRLMVERNLAG